MGSSRCVPYGARRSKAQPEIFTSPLRPLALQAGMCTPGPNYSPTARHDSPKGLLVQFGILSLSTRTGHTANAQQEDLNEMPLFSI